MSYIMFNKNPRVHTFVVLSSPIFGQYGCKCLFYCVIFLVISFLFGFNDSSNYLLRLNFNLSRIIIIYFYFKVDLIEISKDAIKI